MASKSFMARLAALEALEAEREARQRQQYPGDLDKPPYQSEPWDLTACGDWENWFTLLYGLRDRWIRYESGRISLGHGLKPGWESFNHTLIEIGQRLIDECPKPFIPLLHEEVVPALALVDAGRVTSYPRAVQWNQPAKYHRLHLQSGELGEYRIIDFVNFAYELLIEQDPDAPVLATVDDWRAWLVELITPIDAEP